MLPDPVLQKESTHDRGKASGFARSLVPTLEEKVIAEHQPPTEYMDRILIEEDVESSVSRKVVSPLVETIVENDQMFAMPADASLPSKTSTQPPYVRMGNNDTDVEEQKAQRARHLLRKHPNVKLGQLPRTVPTHKPKYDADSFEDPVCDQFWEDIWVACAVHNVGVYRFLELEAIGQLTNTTSDRDLPSCFPRRARRPCRNVEALQGLRRISRTLS